MPLAKTKRSLYRRKRMKYSVQAVVHPNSEHLLLGLYIYLVAKSHLNNFLWEWKLEEFNKTDSQ